MRKAAPKNDAAFSGEELGSESYEVGSWTFGPLGMESIRIWGTS